MRSMIRIALALVGLALVVGGGIAAVSPRTAQIAANRAATLVVATTDADSFALPAVQTEVWVGREHKTPGRSDNLTGTVSAPRVEARLDGRSPLLRNEAFISSSRQEKREQFRVWGIEAQILGLLLLIATGLTGRRRVPFRPNRAATTPVTPVAPTPTGPADPPVSPDPDLVVGPPTEPEKTAEPVQPVPAAVKTAVPPVDETGGDLEPAPQSKTPTEPLVEAASDADPAAVAELTVRVTRADGAVEQVDLSGPKVAEAGWIDIQISRTIGIDLKA